MEGETGNRAIYKSSSGPRSFFLAVTLLGFLALAAVVAVFAFGVD